MNVIANLFHIGTCAVNPNKTCVSNLAYETSKTSIETIASLALWGSKQALEITTDFTKNVTFIPTFPKHSEFFNHLYTAGTDKAAEFSLQATSWITGRSFEQFSQSTALSGSNGEDILPSFQAIDLIGPALLFRFSANKTLENLVDFKQSLTNRKVTTAYTNDVENCTMVGGCKSLYQDTKQSTRSDKVISAACTIAWGALSYVTYQGIYNTLEKASINSDHALFMTNAILIASVIAPKAIGWIHEALTTSPPTPQISPKNTSELVYINPSDAEISESINDDSTDSFEKVKTTPNPRDFSPLTPGLEQLSPEAAVQFLKKLQETSKQIAEVA